MIFKIRQTKRERKPYKLDNYLVVAQNKEKAEADLKRFLGKYPKKKAKIFPKKK
jgi:hypothetical protein